MSQGSAPSLFGRVALVTGGGTGVGLTIARGFAKQGCKVYITGRREHTLKASATASEAEDWEGKLVPLVMDVTSQSSIDAAVSAVQSSDGKLDVLVNNAGIANASYPPTIFQDKTLAHANGGNPLDHESFDGWSELFRVNVSAAFFVTRAFLDLLVKGAESGKQDGRETSVVINISSMAVNVACWSPLASMAYPISKSALDKLSAILATDFAHRKIPIRVNTIHPGVFPSELTQLGFLDGLKDFVNPGYVAPIPSGRAGSEDEMQSTAVYLATNEYTNGTILRVDGGLSLVNP